MQSYSHPDVFFCPLYNRPGISDPKMNLCGSDDEYASNQTDSRSGSPTSSSSDSSSSSSSRSSSLSPPTSPFSDQERKLRKFKRMSVKAGKSLLDFATEVEGRRILSEKRREVQAHLKVSQSCRNSPERPQPQPAQW